MSLCILTTKGGCDARESMLHNSPNNWKRLNYYLFAINVKIIRKENICRDSLKGRQILDTQSDKKESGTDSVKKRKT